MPATLTKKKPTKTKKAAARKSKRTAAAQPKPARARAGGRGRVRVLFSCAGRRVELIQAFRRAGEELGIKLELHGSDASAHAPALSFVDRAHTIPTVASGKYEKSLLALARKERIDLVIPLNDHELQAIADLAPQLAQGGTTAVVSDPKVVRICRDKIRTFQTLFAAGIDTPKTWTWRDAMERTRNKFPMFIKPRGGSAAIGATVLKNRRELEVMGSRVKRPIVQEFIPGIEHTLDVYCGLSGGVRCVVPRKRIEIRAGEVSKGVTVKSPKIMALGKAVAEALGECRGIVTVQCIVTKSGRMPAIEINPRFGGGAPLGIAAGANYPKWILQEFLGKEPKIRWGGFRGDVAMLRYDQSVFVEGATKKLKLGR